MLGCARGWVTDFAPAAVVLLAGVVLSGCGSTVHGPQSAPDRQKAGPVDELSANRAEVCPAELPQRRDPGYGFGNEEPADASPSLAFPDSAWVCRYLPVASGPGPGGQGTTWGWNRVGAPRRVDAADLTMVGGYLSELRPVKAKQPCTADLGQRFMLVYAVGHDLTGLVVDDYGCRNVRLTDEPVKTPPGDATQPGTVSGVLSEPDGLLAYLKTVAEQP